jgi:hypothetical protein
MAAARQAHKNSHTDSHYEGDKRAMLYLPGKAVYCMVAKLRGLAAELRRFVAHGIGASAKPLGDTAQGCRNCLPDMVGCLQSTRGRAPADALQALLDRPQSPFDFPDIGRHRAGMSELTEHHEPPWIGEMKTAQKD